MSDINQWRRMIHPVKSRSSTVTTDAEPLSPTLDGSVEPTPFTPKKRARPQLSSRFSSILGGKSGLTIDGPLAWADQNFVGAPEPRTNEDCSIVVESLMSHVFDHLHDAEPSLGRHQSSQLFRVLEDYRRLHNENERLVAQLSFIESEHQLTLKLLRQHQQKTEQTWASEEEKYRAEIKRLEILIAKSSKGMSGLMQAREGSVIDRKRTRRRSKQDDIVMLREDSSSLDLLGEVGASVSAHNKHTEKVMRSVSISPSNKMIKLSETLANTGDRLGNAAIGTPPRSLLQPFRETARTLDIPAHENSTRVTPDDTHSVFSTAGDMFPEEVHDDSVIEMPSRQSTEDVTMIKSLASVVARKRGISLQSVLPTILDLFSGSKSVAVTNNATVLSDNPTHVCALLSHDREPSVASLESDKSRPFSFVAGDDNATRGLPKSRSEVSAKSSKMSRQVSMSSPKPHFMGNSSLGASTARQRASQGSRKQSKIPSPVSDPSFARSRQESPGTSGSAVQIRESSGNVNVNEAFGVQEKDLKRTTSLEWHRRDIVLRRI